MLGFEGVETNTDAEKAGIACHWNYFPLENYAEYFFLFLILSFETKSLMPRLDKMGTLLIFVIHSIYSHKL